MNVREATHRYNTAFVSSIRTYGNLGPFRPANRADFKGVRLFDMLLRPNQVVCGSTVRPGDPDGSLYGNWGVIIGEGDIQQAFPYDAASYVVDGKAVSPYGWRNNGIPIETQVSRAIEYRSGHNEVDIALGRASIAGIFIGDHPGGVDGIDLPSDEVLGMIAPLELPTYRLRQGEFYVTSANGYIADTPTPPTDIIMHHATVSGDLQQTLRSELARRLVLPPRNAVSAGWQAGIMQRDFPQSHFAQEMLGHLKSDKVDHRYFGSMAVFAADHLDLLPYVCFTESDYAALHNRILPGGILTATESDINHYLTHGTTPDYLGKI